MTIRKLSRSATVMLIAASAAVVSLTPRYVGRFATAGEADGQLVTGDTVPAATDGVVATGSDEDPQHPDTPEIEAAETTDAPKDRPEATADADNRVSSKERILKELGRQTSINFFDIPLSEAINQLEAMHKIPIEMDARQVLTDAGVDIETPVSRQLEGITLESALKLILRDLNLTYVIKDEVLLITTPENAETEFIIRIYRIDREWPATPDQFVTMITKIVAPNTWETGDYEGGAIHPIGHALVVRQTREVHEEIEDLIAQLGEFLAAD